MTNPLYRRLTHQTRDLRSGPVMGRFLFAVGLGMLSAILSGGAFEYTTPGPLDIFSNVVAWLFAWLAPVATAVIGAELTSRDTITEIYHLMCVTTIRNGDIVQGFFQASLYRARNILILAGFILPLLGGAIVRDSLLSAVDCSNNYYFKFTLCPNAAFSTRTEWLGWSVTALALIVGFLGMHFMTASIGIATALWCRRITKSRYVVMFSVFIVSFPLAFAYIPVLTALLHPLNYKLLIRSELPSLTAFRLILIPAIISVCIPYLFTVVILRVAQVQARQG